MCKLNIIHRHGEYLATFSSELQCVFLYCAFIRLWDLVAQCGDTGVFQSPMLLVLVEVQLFVQLALSGKVFQQLAENFLGPSLIEIFLYSVKQLRTIRK